MAADCLFVKALLSQQNVCGRVKRQCEQEATGCKQGKAAEAETRTAKESSREEKKSGVDIRCFRPLTTWSACWIRALAGKWFGGWESFLEGGGGVVLIYRWIDTVPRPSTVHHTCSLRL